VVLPTQLPTALNFLFCNVPSGLSAVLEISNIHACLFISASLSQNKKKRMLTKGHLLSIFISLPWCSDFFSLSPFTSTTQHRRSPESIGRLYNLHCIRIPPFIASILHFSLHGYTGYAPPLMIIFSFSFLVKMFGPLNGPPGYAPPHMIIFSFFFCERYLGFCT